MHRLTNRMQLSMLQAATSMYAATSTYADWSSKVRTCLVFNFETILCLVFNSASLPRPPWRSSNQNDYLWRDAHLPAYREATVARSQTPTDQTRVWQEPIKDTKLTTVHCKKYVPAKESYICRPISACETRVCYTPAHIQHSFYTSVPS
jgi:hypothetical protein